MAIIDMNVKGPKANHTVAHPIRNQPKCKNWWSFMMGFSVWCFDWENDFHFFFGYAYMIHMEVQQCHLSSGGIFL